MQLLIVGTGGFIGSVLRFAIGGAIQRVLPMAGFPFGILIVNVLGCGAIGVVTGFADSRDVVTAEMRLFVAVGVLGGFTTFSAFANDGVAMIRDHAFGEAIATIALHVIVCFAAVWFGYRWANPA